MKKILALFAAAFLFSCSAPQGVQWFAGSFAEAIDAAKATNKPILLDFYSDT